MQTITNEIHNQPNGFTHVKVGDEVDTKWGYREMTISIKDIVHLLAGGCLYHTDGEYASVIALEREVINNGIKNIAGIN